MQISYESEIYELLKKYNIDTPKYKVFDKEEKLKFDIFPCVLKVMSKNIIHKSDVGGVVLNVKNNKELNEVKKNLLRLNPEKFLVEEELAGIELFIGGIYDNIFGKVLIFGAGGTLLEIQKDITYIDIKATKKEIKQAVLNTKTAKIFPSFRGNKYDIDEVVSLIQKFQKLFKNEEISEFDINPILYTKKGLVAVDARLKFEKIVNKNWKRKKISLFENKNVAIIGVSENKNKVGYAIAKNSLKSKSNIYFVNPKFKKLFNKKVYKLEELTNIDIAVIAIPPKSVFQTIEFLAKKGTKNFIIISAGFKEVGNKQAELDIKKLSIKYNLNIVGPNCLGIYNSTYNLNLTFGSSSIYNGEIGLISQSGAVLTALMDKASHYKIGFSHIISMGNMADFNFANAIEELNNQDNCKIISIYAEGIQYGKEFLKAIRKSKKPILFFKSGKSERAKKAAFSHTGNIAGDYQMIVSLSKLAGAKIKSSIESLIYSSQFEENEIIIVTNAGGPGTILTDLVIQNSKKLKTLDKKTINQLNKVLPNTWSKNNPVDIIGDATPKRYQDTLDILKDKSNLIFVIITPQLMTDTKEIAQILLKYKNAVPIFLGEESFKIAKKIFENRLFFNSLQDSVSVL